MRYTLTGNFQYDLGIFGLKKVLDFFNEPYKTDENFYIEVDKKPEELLELVILKLISNETERYFFDKVADTIFKNNKEAKKKIEEEVNNLEFNLDLKNLAKTQKSLDYVISLLSQKIFEKLKQIFPDEILQLRQIENIVWGKSVNLLNNVLLNFQADMKVAGKEALQKAVDKLYKDISEETICSFCEAKPGKRITRDTFFFAPAQFNAFWSNEPSVFICPYCLVSNLAITQSFTFLGNKLDALAIYRPNLSDLENLNTGLKITDIGQLTQKIIEYEKLALKKEATLKDLQILEFYLDPQNPNLEFYLLTDDILENFLKLQNILEKLYTTYKNSLWGQIKDKNGYININLSKEILKSISMNQKLFYIVLKYAKLSLMAESFRHNKTKNPPVKGFFVDVLLEILKMHFELEDLKMSHFEAFKEYGQFLRGKVISQLSEGGDINWNTFNNKIIALANSFLEASKGSLDQFMETLTRVIISYDAPITADHLSYINKENYREIATVIALSVMTEKSKGDKKDVKQVEENAI
ncbi:hypothetical protein [Persephonella sp.]